MEVEASESGVGLTREQFRQAEIQNLGGTVTRDHQILRLQIAMNDSNCVRFGESVGNLRGDGDSFAEWNWARGQQFPHRLPSNQFHGDVVGSVHVTKFINRDDVGMIERAGGAGFLLKAR